MRLPWKRVRRDVPAGAVASVTRLRLARWRDMPAFLWVALRLRAALGRHRGAVALALWAQPWRRTFWTLSVWEGQEAVRGYVSSPRHAAAMRRFRSVLSASSARWEVADGRLPTWDEAVAALSSARLGAGAAAGGSTGAAAGAAAASGVTARGAGQTA